MTNLTPINLGETIISYSISSNLPSGLIFNTTTGVISGTPTQLTNFTNYIITGYSSTGSMATTNINIRVADNLVLSISNPNVWVDASDTTTYTASGSSITSLKNKMSTSSFIGNATVSSTTLNSLPLISIPNNTILTLNSSLTFTSSQRTVFIVQILGASNNIYFHLYDPNTMAIAYSSSNGLQYADYPSGGSLRTAAANLTPMFNTSSLVTLTNATGDAGLYINGNSTTPVSSVSFTPKSTTTFGIGSSYIGYTLGEMIIYDGPVTTSEREMIEGYLAWKWGLQAKLPSNHPYKNAAP